MVRRMFGRRGVLGEETIVGTVCVVFTLYTTPGIWVEAKTRSLEGVKLNLLKLAPRFRSAYGNDIPET